MSQLVALSVSIGVLGGIATFLFLNSGLLIWAAFVAWACFFHSGGDTNGLRNTIVGNVFGAFCAWLAAVILLSVSLGGTLGLPLWAAIVVGVTVLGMCLAAHIKAFSVIPASVYGYAATFAFLLQTAGMLNKDKLLSASLQNGLVVVALSMVIGALFGFASGKVGALLAK
jgi:hypothetical protein